MKKFDIRPEIVAFSSGALVMIFEILGSRVVGPYIGTSLFVWTSLIALILGALSIGHYLGGILADRGAGFQEISKIFLLSSLSISLLILSKDIILLLTTQAVSDIRFSSILLAFILFSPTSFLLGLLSPIVTKIRMHDIETGGRVIGKIGSIGTIGSIIGTLAAGFFLIPFFGVTLLLILLAGSCLILSYIGEPKKYRIFQIFMLAVLIGQYIAIDFQKVQAEKLGQYTYDTPYSHISISQRVDEATQKNVKDLHIDNVTHAGMFLEDTSLVYDYTKYYHLHDILFPTSKKILMFGGAAYSYPKSFLEKYPDKTLDVVEIDSAITGIAKKHFRLVEDPRLKIYHQDARVFLNTTQEKYDVLLGDAFGSYYSIPYQLTTREVAQKKYDMLSDNGIVLLNVIGSLEGESAAFLQAEYKTYKEVFPEVFVIPVYYMDGYHIQNIMLVAAKNKESLNFETDSAEYTSYLAKRQYLQIPEETNILTDDFAPVDYYIGKMIE